MVKKKTVKLSSYLSLLLIVVGLLDQQPQGYEKTGMIVIGETPTTTE